MEGKKKYYCKFPNCKNKYAVKARNKCFFRFPRDPQMLRIWKDICQISDDMYRPSFVICGDHFSPNDFVNERKIRLVLGAVPSDQYDMASQDAGTLVSPLSNITEVSNSIPLLENIVETPMVFENNVESLSIQTVSEERTLPCPCFDMPSLSNFVPGHDCPHSINLSTVISSDLIHDHGFYTLDKFAECPKRSDRYSFLDETEKETEIALLDVTPTQKNLMHKIHCDVTSKIVNLKDLLKNESSENQIDALKSLYKANRFKLIESHLNVVTQEFFNSQLQDVNFLACTRRYSDQDKAFALSMYKKSPRLYKYLLSHFQLPSIRTLEAVLAKIPFDIGISDVVLKHLHKQVLKMKCADRTCALLFDEIPLSQGLTYDCSNQFSGFEDFSYLKRVSRAANQALVFMVRGLRKQWKHVIAYYYTVSTSGINLKLNLIKDVIGQLQAIGLNVVATVCDQSPTNQSAIKILCSEHHPYYFFINDQPIVTIFDVPHLLKDTRDSLLHCKIQFEPNKQAKFEYIEKVFDIDQQKSCRALPKLRKDHFNFTDPCLKMKVEIAAAQLSSSVASSIETFTVLCERLPADAIFTSEFVQLIDQLFDSLNGSSPTASLAKPYGCALREGSPHWDLWSKLLIGMDQWKLIDLISYADCTEQYSFVRGWQITMRSIMYLWHRLKDMPDFSYLNLRSLNQDPLENLFCSIRQHGLCPTNPTCHQFTAALKTVVVNRLVSPTSEGNCEKDSCTPLEDLDTLLQYSKDVEIILAADKDAGIF